MLHYYVYETIFDFVKNYTYIEKYFKLLLILNGLGHGCKHAVVFRFEFWINF